jgi:uncharacterized protein YjbI with pentapeptide repeats
VQHTITEALDRFQLIEGKGDGETTACVMSAISWVAGEAFTDAPTCAHPILTRLAIAANDAAGTTTEQRAEILRAGETGLLDTWWVPGQVIAIAQAQPKPADGETLPDETPVARCLRVLANITAWKVEKARPDLRSANLGSANLGYADLGSANLGSANLRSADLGSANLGSANLRSANLGSANLGYANLRSADLRSANLRSANLRYANLGYANLRSANLRSADLGSADLRSADLRSANLRSADLRSANLRSANLRSADLGSANLRSANLRSADLGYADLRSANLRSANLRSALNFGESLNWQTARGNSYTVLPKGWHIDEATGLVVADVEAGS